MALQSAKKKKNHRSGRKGVKGMGSDKRGEQCVSYSEACELCSVLLQASPQHAAWDPIYSTY